jgi:Tetracyclin repressor-like, C-terminal domain
MVRRHPWALAVPLARIPFGPRRLAWLERGLSALEETALSEDEKAALILLVNNYVFSEARLSAELGDAQQEPDAPSDPVPDQGALLSALADAERFPAPRRALEAGIFDPSKSDRDGDFAFGLERSWTASNSSSQSARASASSARTLAFMAVERSRVVSSRNSAQSSHAFSLGDAPRDEHGKRSRARRIRSVSGATTRTELPHAPHHEEANVRSYFGSVLRPLRELSEARLARPSN